MEQGQEEKTQPVQKKYFPIGGKNKLHDSDINFIHKPLNMQSLAYANSYVSPGIYLKKPNPLPDIYTTCPELKQFKPIISFQNQVIQKSRPPSFDPEKTIIVPSELGFIPESDWSAKAFSLWELREKYFMRRNGAIRQFDCKLFNALRITLKYPDAYQFVGAIWITNSIMKIDSQIFAHLLNIHAVQGGLFHKQGNFSRHGFQHILRSSSISLMKSPDCSDVDDYQVRLYQDKAVNGFRDGYFRFTRDFEPSCFGRTN
ncbi:hypothetical protein GPJ56_006928 [Histomonas meleagridis]|uniref:uncharacterized protein n=1 Tax=Histomonas meleagridis TaxID=135588 RepID=UPI00355A6266|nr:hypothetical protein GPJ56_006928 [Histomonas meleagridis]KAH0800293.1 hypothetical protein GO595_006882 [Histomonas meleagridis]